MRRSAWILPAITALLWLAAVGYPAMTALIALATTPGTGIETGEESGQLLRTIGWSLTVAIGAAVLGWVPGRALGTATGRRGHLVLATLMLAPICLPAYVVFFAWWQAWPADSAFFRWASQHDLIVTARQATLMLGLWCWSWPIVAWCVAGSASMASPVQADMLALDGADRSRRLAAAFRNDRRGLALGALIVFLCTFGNTTCFDLAEIFTFANQLRAIEALNGSARDILVAGSPAMLIALLGAAAVWLAILGRPESAPRQASLRRPASLAITGAIWCLSAALPLALIVVNLVGRGGFGGHVRQFIRFYGDSLVNTLGLALGASALIGLATLGFALAWQDHRRWPRAMAHGAALTWLLAGLVPATVATIALESAYNREGWLSVVYGGPMIAVLVYVGRFGFIGALLGWWLAAREPADLVAMRRLDGAATLGAWLQATRPRAISATIATMAITFVLSIGEVPVTAQLSPPGAGPLASGVLNAMHYQRPETVIVATIITAFLALTAAAVVAMVLIGGAWVRRHTATCVFLLALTTALVGCGDLDPDSIKPLRPTLVFGATGGSLGQFSYPRGIAIDRDREWVYIVDKTARVQRFGFDGEPRAQWSMPAWENGKPTGLNVSPDGRVFVADTHYHRVIVYDLDGNESTRWGTYGVDPGQFIYPTDVEFGADGRVYVSEYGGNDRVQIFTATGEFLSSFGTFGPDPGQFDRPQSMVFSEDRSELYIADACNHRIVVVDPEGGLKRILGTPGRAPGEMSYPYDVTLLKDGSLLVCEYENHRVQRISSSDGRCLALLGQRGGGHGQLSYPWGVDRSENRVFVLDSRNNRVQVIRNP